MLGDNSIIQNNVELYVYPSMDGIVPNLSIGNNVLLQKNVTIGCANKIIIEDNVSIAGNVHISDRDKSFENIDELIMLQPSKTKGPIIIKEGSWIGFGSQIMSGVTIGKHCVVAAGSIVTKNVPDYSVVAGNPAKLISRYNFEIKKWEKV